MTVRELMTSLTINSDFEGTITNDDFCLAINTSGITTTDPLDYHVFQSNISGVDHQYNAQTQSKTYIRAGESTTKTGTQDTFSITGDRYVGDSAQDFCFKNSVIYGTGNGVIVDYVFFCILNGKGNKGLVSIVVNSDGGGDAGNNAEIDIELMKFGSTPTEWVYSSSSTASTMSMSSSSSSNTLGGV